MRAVQLPSGSYRVQVMIDGVSHSITRKTAAEALREAEMLRKGITVKTLRQCCLEYIELREAVLSASTIRGYKQITANMMQTIMDSPAAALTTQEFQRAVNLDLKTHSPKTMQNAVGFIQSVLADNEIERKKIRLPQIIRNERAFLEPEELLLFVEAIRGHKWEAGMLLMCHGLRASEAMNVKRKNITDNGIAVRGAAVLGENDVLVRQEANKNQSSRRDVPVLIPNLLVAVAHMRPEEYVCPANKSQAVHHAINSVCRKLGFPEIGCHGLRHSFCSLCYSLGLSEKTTMALGGWSDFNTMRKIYTHLSQGKRTAETEKLTDFFTRISHNSPKTRVPVVAEMPLPERTPIGAVMVEAAGIELDSIEEGCPSLLADYSVYI